MAHRHLVAAVAVAAAAFLVPLGARAQSAEGQGAPRMPWGAPNLQGVWDFATGTPLEPPAEFAGQETLSDEDAAAVIEPSNQRWQCILEGHFRGASRG